MNWPDGYEYDPATKALYKAGSARQKSAPVYVTEITLFIAKPDEEAQSVNVPLATLRVRLTLSMGPYLFEIRVNTKQGDTFTGASRIEITPATSSILIDLEVNGLSLIKSLTADSNTPTKRSATGITVDYLEPDDDEVTITWTASGGVIVGSGSSVN